MVPAGSNARGRIAYFSMEIALQADIPTYSGGLGVLAGDTMRSAADLRIPLVGVTLASRSGYFRQRIEDGRQVEESQSWSPEAFARPLPVKVRVAIAGRPVWIGGWEYQVRACAGHDGSVPVLLLDTDLPENAAEDRRLTHHLYGGDAGYRLRQEIVLGIGGVRMLHALGLEPARYHLNEGHAAFLTLELLRLQRERGLSLARAVQAVRSHCVFTTHTPVPAGHDQFDYALVKHCLEEQADLRWLRTVAGEERLNMTLLALRQCGWVNGVAQRHAEVSRRMFPGHQVHAITNGVHPWTWASDAHRGLYDRYLPHWATEPEYFAQAQAIPAAELARAHAQAKDELLAYARAAFPDAGLQAHRFTIGFARRMTSYKRPHLLFSDPERLARLARRYPLQVVLAGKAHPHDAEGKRHIGGLLEAAQALREVLPVVFLPDYDMRVARLVVAGADVWLNTPQRPLEASGTSGMKAALNGVPNLSVLDGWWLEGCVEGVTGWAIGDDGPHDPQQDQEALYDQLERKVLPLYFDDPAAWLEVGCNAIVQNASFFNSHRMLRRYALEAYAR